MRRFLKQLVYGGFYLALWSILLGGVYLLFLKPTPSCFDRRQNQGEKGVDCEGPCGKICLPPTTRQLELVGNVKVFYPGSPVQKRLSVLAQFQNPNSNYAVKKFRYTFTLYDFEGNVVQSFVGTSFLHGGEIKYIAEVNKLIDQKVARAEVSLHGLEWAYASEFRKPNLLIQTQSTHIANDFIETNGVLVNNDTLEFSTVTIFVAFFNRFGEIVGVSKVETENVMPQESRPFTVIHPIIPDVDTAATRVFAHAFRP